MRGFRLGRVFGIELRIDWSWVFIFVLLTWNLVALFSRWHPDWTPLGAFVVAAVAALAFFACILLHELAHSLVGMRYGMRVRSITLFLFGGVSNIEREPPSAKAEFWMAIVGPIVSIVLGMGFTLLASLVTTIPAGDPGAAWNALAALGPVATLLAWLGPVNVAIGLFNLVPGFPLDGGRVFRAIVWKLTGDLRTATLWASASGRLIGWLLIACGIAMSFGAYVPVFGTGFAGGIWLAFIGWFLHGAALQATTRLALDDALAGMMVGQLMRREGPVATPELSVADLVQEHLIPSDERALPVVEDGELLGLVSVTDIRKVPPHLWATTSVRAIMRPVETLSVATPEDPLAKAFAQLAERDVDQLPVVANGKLVGMLRRQDIARWLELAWKPSAAATSPRTSHGPSTPTSPPVTPGGFDAQSGAHHPV
jgi:Zn-dependent protease/CBS domain-containing protein